MKKPREFEFLIDAFKSLPSVGTKNAKRLAYHIIGSDAIYVNEFINRIFEAKQNIKLCSICNALTNEFLCPVCQNHDRDKKLCIVINHEDFEKIDDLDCYFGYYHILNLSIKNNNKIDLEKINIAKIISQIDTYDIYEVILATNFSIIGELIAEYIKTKLEHMHKINIYRLGFGLSLNASINYTDKETIKESLENKRRIK